LHVLTSAGHPEGNSLYISEGIQAFTLLVIFQHYYGNVYKNEQFPVYWNCKYFILTMYNYD